ncbi:MAG: fumarylacetoacetate hydrolase family protein [Legionellaceae bacterium]|nr:fumarylacetoacetate hydrolase family protein [Legionellaceae bacterium]
MRLVRFGDKGDERAGILDESLNIRDISDYVSDYEPSILNNSNLFDNMRKLDIAKLPLVDSDVRIGSPIKTPGKLIFIGFNSQEHAQEMGVQVDLESEPIIFMKPNCVVSGPFDPISYSSCLTKLDWEAELAIVIGKQGKYISKENARDYIFGYTCCNDLSDRHLQFETSDTQFTKGKCFDGSAPLGPYIVTKDEVSDSAKLEIKLWVNGHLRQNFKTSDYIHNEQSIISYLSKYFTLYPGDIISMGSAPGSASSWKHEYLKPNDSISMQISGLGTQKQVVVSEI